MKRENLKLLRNWEQGCLEMTPREKQTFVCLPGPLEILLFRVSFAHWGPRGNRKCTEIEPVIKLLNLT